ncbi:DUF2723 domain-containing protein [Candidatus Woesearchaeota archaeon]|nr:DUF2723 domain-containing protein [Candidatus Woesearchaeota archaeon]
MMEINPKIKAIIGSHYFYGVLCAILSFTVYLLTLAPSVYWGDSGELITVAYTLGIAHPSGYPTYTLLGHLFTYIPFGSVAWRVNLMSAVFASLAVMLLYFICWKLTKSKIASFTASLIFAFSATFWSQAVIAEVYTLHAFFMALNILILLHWRGEQDAGEPKHLRWLYLFSFTYGLSLTNHITSILFAPGFLYFILVKKHEKWFKITWNTDVLKLKIIGICAGLFLVGLLPYAYLPIRSSMDPVWNWGQISTFQDFFWHLTGKAYQQFFGLSNLFENSTSSDLVDFSSITIIILGVCGLGLMFRKFKSDEVFQKTKENVGNASLIFVFLIIFPVLIHAFSYAIGDIINYLLPAFVILTLPSALFIAWLESKISGKVRYILYGLLGMLVVSVGYLGFISNDLTEDLSAEHYWRNICESVPSGSIILGKDTHDSFIPLYLQNVDKKCTNVFILNYYDFTKPWRLDYIKKILPQFNVNGIKEIYQNMSEADAVAITKINQLFEESSNNQSIYSTFRNITTNYHFSHYGHLFKVSNSATKLNFPPIKYDYNIVKNEEGKEYVSRVLVFYGIDSITEGRYKEAIAFLQKAVELNPNSFEGWNDLGIAYYKNKQINESLIVWEKALEIKEDIQLRKNIKLLKKSGVHS